LALNEMLKRSEEFSILETDSERGLACILLGVFGKPWFSLLKRASLSTPNLALPPSHLGSLQPIWLLTAQDAAVPIAATREVLGARRSAIQMFVFKQPKCDQEESG